jgi:hypothetical protein
VETKITTRITELEAAAEEIARQANQEIRTIKTVIAELQALITPALVCGDADEPPSAA